MSPCRPAPARPVHRRHSSPNPQENAAAAQRVVPRQLEFRRNENRINSLQKTGVQVGSEGELHAKIQREYEAYEANEKQRQIRYASGCMPSIRSSLCEEIDETGQGLPRSTARRRLALCLLDATY